jgi:hypothetical protein
MPNYKEVFQLAKDKGYGQYWTDDAYTHLADGELNVYQELCCIQKWMRDEHKIVLSVASMNPYFQWFLQDHEKETEHSYLKSGSESTYEEALLQGVLEGLKLLK